MLEASITISGLAWSTPDGRNVFSNLNLSFGDERAGLVGRNRIGKTTLLKLISGEILPSQGKITVKGKLAVLRQIVQVSAHETIADLFGATEGLELLLRVEAGAADLEEMAAADWMLETRLASALHKVGLAVEPGALLTTLSGGQRTRAHLAAALFEEPDFLLLDEPTNNLDRAGRKAILALLTGWRAGAIVVSHDRELLEAMDAIVELTTLGATRYGGNWSYYREQKEIELAAAEHDLATAEKRVSEVARKTQAIAERKERRDRAGERTGAKGDLPRILLGGRKNRAESTGGSVARLAERQRSEAQEAAAAARERIEKLQPMAVNLPSTNLSAGKTVLEIVNMTAGYQAHNPVIRDFSFQVVGPERVAIEGVNGSGKTTLLGIVSGQIQPWTGSVRLGTLSRCSTRRQVSLIRRVQSVTTSCE